MRVSVVNFCSTALDMLKFSTEMLIENAGTSEFDYFVATWLPTPEVAAWVKDHPRIWPLVFPTQPGLDYVPQLRAMMNYGFDIGLAANDRVVIVNTDMAFGRDWLKNLMRRAEDPAFIPNSLHITPVDAGYAQAQGVGIIKGDYGIPTIETFDARGFNDMVASLYRDAAYHEHEVRGGWESCATFPYVLHRKWWDRCGPWELELGGQVEAPDRRFFRRCHEAGARFLLCHDSIVYHHEAVERRRGRPPGAEHLAEGA